MIKVLFFAKLREELGLPNMQVEFVETLDTIQDLINTVGDIKGDTFKQALMSDEIVVSRNHDIVSRSESIQDNDEIAFYPPVTGG